MKKIIYIATLFSVAFTFFACDPESFEQVVTFNVPKEKARLVVSCEYLNSSDTLQVFVSSSWNTTDTILPTSRMDNCKVELYKGTQKIADVPYKLTQIGYGYGFLGKSSNVTQGYYVTKLNGALNEKEVYTLRVSAPDFETVEAKSAVPQLINIKKVTYKKDGFKSLGGGFGGSGGNTLDLFSIEFDDPSDENFYSIECIEYLRDTTTKKLYEVTKNFAINQQFNADIFNDGGDYNRDFLFSDNIFNGKTFVFKMGAETSYPAYFNNPDGNSSNNRYKIEGYDIRLHTMSRERFIFNNSLDGFYNNQDNPFGEPIPLYTNFDKGFGLFSFLNTSRFYVKI